MRLIKITSFFLLVSFLYALLIVGDWYLERVINSRSVLNNSDAILLEEKRKLDQDLQYIDQALNEGYIPFLPPGDFDSIKKLSSKMKDSRIGVIGSFPNKKLFYCNEGFGLIKYKSDRFGLRNDDKIWDKKIDALFIGDSFTHGACVEEKDTIPFLFGKLNQKNVVNLGSGGNNSLHYKTLAHLFIPKVRPESVYLIFYQNDKGFFHSTSHNINLDKNNTFFGEGVLLNKPYKYNELFTYAQQLLSLSESNNKSYNSLVFKIINSISMRKTLPTIRSLIFDRFGENFLGDASDAINYAHKICEEFNCELNIVMIPNSDFWRPYSYTKQFAHLLNQEAKKLNINFFDASEIIDTSEGSVDYGLGGHLSPTGYSKVTKLISE